MERSGTYRDPLLEPAFDAAAAASGFTLDADQRRIARRLSRLSSELQGIADDTPRGVYLWGPAGRGKTWLLDAFVASLPTGTARRIHFHGFFRQLHESIQRNRERPDADASAIELAVDELLGGASLLHFEEFHVHDSGNAALLVRLLETLFEKGVTLIASSNYAPGGLFADPDFHYVFRPGIALITRHLDVLALDGGADYRLASVDGERNGFARGRWFAGEAADAVVRRPDPDEAVALTIDGRSIRARRAHDCEVWFTFAELLEASTAVSDYLALCARFDSWVLDEVPDFVHASIGARQRFVNLIDVLCDLGIELRVFAVTSREVLAAAPELPADMPRTLSRLAMLAPGKV